MSGVTRRGISPPDVIITEFFSDWKTDGTAVRTFQLGDSTWSDGSTAATANPAGNIAADTRAETSLSDITVPGGTTLDKYSIHYIEAQYYESGDGKWHVSKFIYVPSGSGIMADIYDDNSAMYVQSGLSTLWSAGNTSGGSNPDITGRGANHPCRVKIVCSR